MIEKADRKNSYSGKRTSNYHSNDNQQLRGGKGRGGKRKRTSRGTRKSEGKRTR